MAVAASLRDPLCAAGVYTHSPPLHPAALSLLAWALLQQDGATARPAEANLFSL